MMASIGMLFAESFARESDEPNPISWRECLRRKASWYASKQALRVADNVLLYQRDSGGWPKNIDMARTLSEEMNAQIKSRKNRNDSGIDNSATYTQLRFLARVYQAAPQPRFRRVFEKGLDYLFAAQYPHGGWPQFYPHPRGYSRYVTFNDNAMIGVMRCLRDIVQKKEPFGFVDDPRRQKAEKAIQKGIECILKCQVIHNGRRLAWCAQHDDVTLKPRPARSYEKISLSGSESVGIVEFLMEIEKPSPLVIEAVQSAVAWFAQVQLNDIKIVRKNDPDAPRGYDKIVVPSPGAPPLWARFYQIETNRPIFCSRDGIIRYNLSEISYERRNGYSWYTGRPRELIEKKYPPWRKKFAPPENVLDKSYSPS